MWFNAMIELLTDRHCPKNETRVFLNILYSWKFIAIKFSKWYPNDLDY